MNRRFAFTALATSSSSSPDELREMLREQLLVWRKAVQSAGIQPE